MPQQPLGIAKREPLGIAKSEPTTAPQVAASEPADTEAGMFDPAVGMLQGVAHTGLRIGEMAAQSGVIPGLTPASVPALQEVQKRVEPRNTGERFGFGLEQGAEFFLPAGAGERAAAWLTSRLGAQLQNAPRHVQTVLRLLPRMGAEATTGGGVTAVQGGNVKEGAAFGAVAPVLGHVVSRGAKSVHGRFSANQEPAHQAAVAYGQRAGIPLDAATATGRPYVQTAQKVVSDSMGGAGVAERFKAGQSEALARTGGSLATRANAGGAPMDPVRAGERVRQAITQKVEQHTKDADTAYDRLRAIEQQQAQHIQQVGGVKAPGHGIHPFTNVAMAVDVAPTKATMRPLYESLKREAELVPLMGDKARALTALDRLMGAPDLAPLSVADAALSDLKDMARVEQAFRRTKGQGVAAEVVKHLDESVRAAAKRAGPDAYRALLQGRAATILKKDAIAVLDLLNEEPAQLYRRLVASQDTALEALRAVQKVAPGEVKNVARAYLDGMMETATAEGGFGHADKLWADWRRMGTETKAVLFPDAQHRADLNNFFLLAKKIAANPNPSGTARAMAVLNLGSSVVTYPLARILYSPAALHTLMGAARTGRWDKVGTMIGRATAAYQAQPSH
jgi:hypothetical protein